MPTARRGVFVCYISDGDFGGAKKSSAPNSLLRKLLELMRIASVRFGTIFSRLVGAPPIRAR
jgi:hypothetical protein